MARRVLLRTLPMPILRDAQRSSSLSSSPALDTSVASERAVRILAKSMFKELRSQGYGDREIVQLTNDLLQQLVAEKRGR